MDKARIIKETVEELLEKMSFEGEVFVDNSDEENILANIRTNQAGFLIGQAGTSLDALQHIIRALVNKRNEQPIRFAVDINGYKKDRVDLLRQMACDIARQALSRKVAVTLHPMPAYERRIIHMALCNYSKIETESIGEEPERKIIVRPIR